MLLYDDRFFRETDGDASSTSRAHPCAPGGCTNILNSLQRLLPNTTGLALLDRAFPSTLAIHRPQSQTVDCARSAPATELPGLVVVSSGVARRLRFSTDRRNRNKANYPSRLEKEHLLLSVTPCKRKSSRESRRDKDQGRWMALCSYSAP